MNQKTALPKKNKYRYKIFLTAVKSHKLIFILVFAAAIGALAISASYPAKNNSGYSVVNSPAVISSASSDFSCGVSTVSDIDNNIYRTVKIGGQCWLKDNLKVTKNPSGGGITRHCYDNDANNCNTAGGFYDWDTAMNKSATEGAQGICLNGWHIPKDSEWHILENYLKDDGRTCDGSRIGSQDCDGAGTKLKSGGASGFEGILTGYFHRSGAYYGKGIYTFFWSSTESESGVFGRFLNKNYSTLYRSFDEKNESFSIRCLKN